MGSLTDSAESRIADYVTGNTTTAPTAPLKLRLMTANGTDSSAGTEVVGGTYAAQTIAFGAASSGATSNSGVLQFTGMPACTVTGFEIWDSAGTPFRWAWGAATASKTYGAGDIAQLDRKSVV